MGLSDDMIRIVEVIPVPPSDRRMLLLPPSTPREEGHGSKQQRQDKGLTMTSDKRTNHIEQLTHTYETHIQQSRTLQDSSAPAPGTFVVDIITRVTVPMLQFAEEYGAHDFVHLLRLKIHFYITKHIAMRYFSICHLKLKFYQLFLGLNIQNRMI